jgi:hypothetical protein
MNTKSLVFCVVTLSLPIASADFLLDFLFDSENEGGTFLRNAGLSPKYMAVQP